MKPIIIIDAGHGGNHPVTSKYMTPPHIGKLYQFVNAEGKIELEIREGVINRIMADKVARLATAQGFEVVKIYHKYKDISLAERCYKANVVYQQCLKRGQKAVFLSFHSDAFGMKKQGKGERPRGISFFTSVGETKSDKIATIWYEQVKERLGNDIKYNKEVVFRKDLSDGDIDWEAGYYVLNGTWMPAVLVENLFFTNRKDADLLLGKEYQDAFAEATLKALMRLETEVF